METVMRITAKGTVYVTKKMPGNQILRETENEKERKKVKR